MMRAIRRMALLLGLAAAIAAGGASTAVAEQGGAAETGVLAEYQGETIDLAESWEGAEICHQRQSGEVNCYDSEAAYRAGEGLSQTASASGAGTLALSDCPASYLCLWKGTNYTGERLQLQMDTYLDLLSNYGFEDQVSSIANRSVYYAEIYDNDYPDFPRLVIPPNAAYPDLSVFPHAYGGSWNNRADLVLF
ncbi:peptidase inhibitor family I36 protein [Streptomyces sp. URMC 129]|uniref:peptidase inhibitor family I36 protein n=1 Tax=Streptomyces sp. URMC 129 TaxID=3423407 RepID=UPI003F1B94BC